ncbi:DUF6542 domain-containing protein [Streptomyces sp. NPDC058299]|uniref:DUF6542 domain-containing protein n=1 Tax=Streptomyces sp. NPDC058299 TaxID=3346435 RepID=UPI0036EB85ED
MEQRRTRHPNNGPRRGAQPPAPLPPQARRGPAGERGPTPGAARAARTRRTVRAARPAGAGGRPADMKLTGLGSGLFCIAAMFLLGYLDQLLFGASGTVYGLLFLPVCLLTALWVRDGDVLSAPVVAPIAFTVGLLPVADGTGGLAGRLMGLFTGLATQAGWLYAGTLAAGVTVLVRRMRWAGQRRRQS